MYIREAQFFDTLVLVVKKQQNTRTVWSGIFLLDIPTHSVILAP